MAPRKWKEYRLLVSSLDFITNTGTWKEAEIRRLILPDAANNVLALPPPTLRDVEDSVAWALTNDGNFSVSSAYNYLVNAPPSNMERVYKSIWQWKGPERLKLLLWRILSNGLLTNLARARRKLSLNACCPFCSIFEESCLHVLRGCYAARVIWDAVASSPLDQSFFSFDLATWIFENITESSRVTFRKNWSVLTLDVLWRHRNEFIFCQKKYSVESTTQEIASTVEFSPARSSISWDPPPEGWYKVNCDGSVRSDISHATCGGIIRDERGVPLGAFVSKLNWCSITFAELWAIIHGLRIAAQKKLDLIILESDSTTALNLVQRDLARWHPAAPLVEEIHFCAKHFKEVRWKHVFREANQVADSLAKMGYKVSQDFLLLDNIPAHLSHLVLADLACVIP
ncbi:Ribonuclease H domain [Sesbania bispinosa]|nr:Ribonuclease H domain [Sesbania bispinosa]